MADVGSLWVKLGLKDATYNKGLDNASKKTKSFAGVVKGLGPLIGGAMAVGAVTQLGKAIFNITAEFGSMMSRVKALTGASDKMTNVLREQAKVLGKQTQFTATEAAEAMTFLAMAGLEVDQIYKAMPNTLELAAAGQIELAEAADISTNIMSAYGLQAEDLGRVNDIIANTATNANTNVREFAEAFKMVGPIAKNAGQGIEDISAMIGLLANAGIKGTMAGTALRTMMSKLIQPTGDAAKVLEKFGITTVTIEGQLRPMNDILAEMNQKGMSVADMFTVFDLRAAGAGSVLKDTSLTFEDFVVKVGKTGTAARIAAEQMDNLKGDSLKLKSAWQGMILEIGENSEGILRGAVQLFTDLTNAVSLLFGGENAKVNKRIQDMVDSFNMLSKEEGTVEIQKMEGRVSSLNEEIKTLNDSLEVLKKKKGGLNEFVQAKNKVEELGKELKVVEGILREVSPSKGKAAPAVATPAAATGGGGAKSESTFDPIKFFVKDSEEELDREWAEMLQNFEIFPQSWIGDQAEKISETMTPVLDELQVETVTWGDIIRTEQENVIGGFVAMSEIIGRVANGIANAKGNWAAMSATVLTGITQMVPHIQNVIAATKALFLAKQGEAVAGAAAASQSIPFPGNLISLGTSVAAVLSAIAPFVGSFATGTDFVPYDGLAMVHRGEEIKTRHEVNSDRRGGGGRLVAEVSGRDLRFVLDEEERITDNTF